MMTRTLFAHCAPLAIAASAALSAIPVAAQDTVPTEPVITLPETAPVAVAPAPAPAIVLPSTVVQPAPVVVEPTPVATSQPEPVAAARGAPSPRAMARTTAPAAVASATASSREVPAPLAAAPAATPVVATSPVATETEPAAETTRNDATGEVGLATLLGALGLAAVGGIAFVASRRRRRTLEPDAAAYEPVFEPEPMTTRTAEPMPAAAVFTAPAPTAGASATPMVDAATTGSRSPARANGDPIALPAEVPETFEERDALLRELVAAEPDKANPFISPRARARRAKLIIQSLGRSFQSRKPRFDLSEYTNRWPALRGWQPATA